MLAMYLDLSVGKPLWGSFKERHTANWLSISLIIPC